MGHSVRYRSLCQDQVTLSTCKHIDGSCFSNVRPAALGDWPVARRARPTKYVIRAATAAWSSRQCSGVNWNVISDLPHIENLSISASKSSMAQENSGKNNNNGKKRSATDAFLEECLHEDSATKKVYETGVGEGKKSQGKIRSNVREKQTTRARHDKKCASKKMLTRRPVMKWPGWRPS